MPDISKDGVFFDTKNSKVVESPPEEGVQIVAPGSEMTDALEAEIKRYRDLEAGVVSEPETVSTESVGRSPKAAKSAKAAE